MKRNLVGVVLPVLWCFATQCAGNEIMHPGAWKASMTIVATNPKTQKKMTVGQSSNVFCLSKQYLATDPYLSAGINQEKMREKGIKCTTSDYARSENSAHWRMSCIAANGKKVESLFQAKVSAEKTSVVIDQTVGEGSLAVESSTTVNYVYSGDCTSDMLRP